MENLKRRLPQAKRGRMHNSRPIVVALTKKEREKERKKERKGEGKKVKIRKIKKKREKGHSILTLCF